MVSHGQRERASLTKGIAAPAPLGGPSLSEGMTHLLFRWLRDVLLRTQLQILLMFRFSADVGHASFLVFEDVEDLALYCGALDFVARKLGIELLLFCSLRAARTETRLGEQRCGVARFHTGAAAKENDATGGQNEKQV
jgi:hypothetical protein